MTWEAQSIEVRESWPNVDQSGPNNNPRRVSRPHVVGKASKRAVDIVLAAAALVFWLKQRLVHKRAPLI